MTRAERTLSHPRPELDIRWTEHAACASAPKALFFPDVRPADAGAWRRLRAYVRDLDEDYCRPCPVRLECLTHALTFPEPDGIWAGTTPLQRQQHQDTPEQLLPPQEAHSA